MSIRRDYDTTHREFLQDEWHMQQAECWKVERHSGRTMDQWRRIFTGDQAGAGVKYDKVADALRQGSVRLISPAGETTRRTDAPRLRTRW